MQGDEQLLIQLASLTQKYQRIRQDMEIDTAYKAQLYIGV